MKRLLKYMKKYTWCYIIAMVAMITGIVMDMFSPYIIKRIVDDVIIGKKMALLESALLCLGGITLGRAVLGYIKEYMFDYSSSKVIVKLRKDLFDHIQKLSFSFFDRNNTGELMSRIKEDTENILHALAFGVMLLTEQGIYFIIASVLLFTLNWKLALVSLITMPLIAYLARKLEKRVGEAYEKISDQRAVLNTAAQENIAGVRLVKAFGREKYEIQKFLEKNKENYKLNVEQAEIWSNYHPKIEFLSNVVIVLMTTAGGYLVIGEDMSIGTLVAFSNYIYMLIWPMRLLGWLTNILSQCNASVKKIEKLFKEKPDIKSGENPKASEDMQGHVVFENVALHYNGVPVLNNININAKPGSTVAIMGMTGSGKTSIVNLIGRFYDCTAGNVYIDGVNVREMDLRTLRQQISVVMQDTFLFSDSIEENIRLGSNNISGEDLITAANDAKVNEFVMKLPDGYNTIIGERGLGLSGGQKQRISIARALVRNCRILILDDATSALDMETEYEIQKALQRRRGMTKFIIAHRISAVKDADEILILEAGEIVERGTHRELLALKGRYYETYCEQFEGIGKMKDKEVV
ncbi:MAG: ABC transporter ATP-binding protein/permease [Clostridia bacterium]|nr:ABC transporter ATP-binding protein/permease [Clostridia bacterium]